MHRPMVLESTETVIEGPLFELGIGAHVLAGFDEGSPDGFDPLQLARQMAGRGITLVRYFKIKYVLPLNRCV